MAGEPDHLKVLAAYPDDCQPQLIKSLGSAGGFSGARFWKVHAGSGTFCLRRWPREHPAPEGLEFIQAVLWHVTREGFTCVPLPRETRRRGGYVRHRGHCWQLAPWMPGKADFRENPTPKKLQLALTALAEFHLAAATFPLPNPPAGPSPGIEDRRAKLRQWLSGDLRRLTGHIVPEVWPELEGRARRICAMAPRLADQVLTLLDDCAANQVPLQPCIRDIWHNHVLFDGEQVVGLIDFGSLQPDNVATDVARLLGSLAMDDPQLWQTGLMAYQTVRPLSDLEIELVAAFDRSTTLMAGLNWIDWIYRQRRVFENHDTVLGRLDEIAVRLEHQSRHENQHRI